MILHSRLDALRFAKMQFTFQKININLDPWRLTRTLTLTNEFFFGNLLILAAINKLAADSNLPNELVSFAQKTVPKQVDKY